MLVQIDLLPFEAKTFYLTIIYVSRVRALDENRLLQQALRSTQSIEWFSNVVTWFERWNIAERDWDLPVIGTFLLLFYVILLNIDFWKYFESIQRLKWSIIKSM